MAHVIRAVPGRHAEPQWHTHDLDFQMIYILKGWVIFEYEGQGEVTFRAGSAALQPPGIRHREIRHSDDLELIEICAPAEFSTTLVDPPEGALAPQPPAENKRRQIDRHLIKCGKQPEDRVRR